MSKKIKVINNIHSSVGFYLTPTSDSFRVLPKQGAFLHVTEDELNYIFINQEIIQKGKLWVDDQATRVKLGLETDTGQRTNHNVLQHEEIVKLVDGHHKKLEAALKKIDEPNILLQFVEVARELKIDSIAKIKLIEDKANTKIFEEDD